MVPSSTSVTSGDATCWPSRPLNTEAPLSTAGGGLAGGGGDSVPGGGAPPPPPPPPPVRAAAAAASAAVRSPSSVRSAVWAKPVVSPTTTRMPAPRSRPDDSSSTRPSSSIADDDRLSSTKTSAKSPPVRRAAVSVRWMTDSSSTGDLYSGRVLAGGRRLVRAPRGLFTAIGNKVTAEATLEKVEGRRLTFTVSASDDRGLVAAGKVTRAVVDVERFLEKST